MKRQMIKQNPTRKTIRDSIRASVPDGKLKGAKISLKDDIRGLPVGGFTEYEDKPNGGVVSIFAPSGIIAEHVTIRDHEIRHAAFHKRRPKKKRTEMELRVERFVDDVNVESVPVIWSRNSSERALERYKRKHLAVVAKEVRAILNASRAMCKNPRLNTPAERNKRLLHTLRAMAMGLTYGDNMLVSRNLRGLVGNLQMRVLRKVVELAASKRGRTKAINIMLELLEPEIDPEDILDGKEGQKVDSDLLDPVTHGNAKEGNMEIRFLLPQDTPCAKEKVPVLKRAPDGVILNPARYVAAIVSGDASGLFMRKLKRKMGGTVVIDASGSMNADTHNLKKLCELIPTSTVAYYSGGLRGRGVLAIFAHNGMRYSGELPHNTLMGGNAVDLPALRWLMKRPKPWTLVSDLEFCGGVAGSEIIALALVDQQRRAGNLTVHRSLQSAYEEFGGKGDIYDK